MATASGGKTRTGDRAYRRRQREALYALGLTERLVIRHIAEDLQRNCGVRPRASWRLANELSLEQAARLYNEAAADPQCGMHGSRVWEFEQWPRRGTRPSITRLQVLAQIYGATWTELADLEDLASMTGPDCAEYCEAVKSGRPGVDGPAKDAEIRTSAARLPHGELLTTNVDEQTLAQFEQELARISHLCLSSSPTLLMKRAGRLQYELKVKIEGRQRPEQTQRLFGLRARASVLYGWLLEDLGDSTGAAAQADLSWAYADFANDDGARQWARALQSRIAFWVGDLTDSAELAAHGRQLRADRRIETYLILLEARARAGVGDACKGREALRVWTERGVESDGDSLDGLFDLRLDRQLYLVGNAFLSLKEADQALQMFDASLAAQRTVPAANQFYAVEHLRYLDMFRAHVRRGDLEGAAEAVEPMFTLDAQHRIRMVILSASRIGSELAHSHYNDSRPARRLANRIRHFCAAAASAPL